MKVHFKAFFAGFMSTLVFHQGLLGLLHLMNIVPMAPFNMKASEPLGVPSVISLAFFGGLWGILVWKLVCKDAGARLWIKSGIIGAVGPTAVALLVVFPIKGIPFNIMMVPFGLLLNAAWGLGNTLIIRLLNWP
jgi:hypothetical protein